LEDGVIRPALSRLPGEAPPLIGHNGGPPLDPARRWRAHCWRKARAGLMGKRLPLEVVRRRVARARALGLAYPAYAAILMGSGRDIVGFLFTADAIGLRLDRAVRRGEALPSVDEVAARKLAAAPQADRALMAEAPVARDDLRAALAGLGVAFATVGAAPPPDAPDRAGRAAIRALLDPLGLPGDAVVLVGAREDERRWAEAARLARFIAAPVYFGAAEAGAAP
jgi:hypothetical protein